MHVKGLREEIESFLSSNSARYYVYELCRPDGRTFYVGKGTGRRLFEHELEALRDHPTGETNPYKCNVIRKIRRDGAEILYGIDSLYPADQELQCLEREADLIHRYGRLHEGGPLTNLAGGLGSLSGAAPHSIEKHAATLSGTPDNNPERATLNRFLQGIGPVESVPIKPTRQLDRILPTTPHPRMRKPTPRIAYALIASATAHSLTIRPGVRIPRSFTYEGVQGIIENGVARDMIKAGMASLEAAGDPRDESFRLDEDQCATLTSLVGADHLAARGLL